jgi:5-methylcytosine-specific restriction protein A
VAKKNPAWTRDELILALNLYFLANPLHTTAQHPQVRELSAFLNTLPFHPPTKRKGTFRNPTGVYMTLRCFLRWDPSYPGEGLQGGRLGRDVWDEFAGDRLRLEATAEAIRSAAVLLKETNIATDISLDDESFPEGRILCRLHLLRERNQTLVTRKKQEILQQKGNLACEICGFDFEIAYGALGRGFAECHHRIALTKLPQHSVSRTRDLAIVCSNCHSMLHRVRPWMNVEDLRLALESCNAKPS